MRRLYDEKHAVVGVVVTVLLIGLAVSVTIMINTVYVPQWLEEEEVAHMEDVSSQFAQLKYAMDVQAVLQQRSAISASITMGIDNLPYLSTGKTYGSISIEEQVCDIIIENETQSWNFSVGNIKFKSGNSYFVRQDYIYEAGALIVQQYPDSMLIGKPIFLADYEKISFTIINTTTSIGKSFVSGHGTYPIHTEFIESTTYANIDNITKITVITDYPLAWYYAFESTLKQSTNPYSASMVNLTGVNKVEVDFSGTTNICDFKEVEILAQIAPGWIE